MYIYVIVSYKYWHIYVLKLSVLLLFSSHVHTNTTLLLYNTLSEHRCTEEVNCPLSYTAYGGHATVSGPAHTMQISGDT